jgi:hypothetical protein
MTTIFLTVFRTRVASAGYSLHTANPTSQILNSVVIRCSDWNDW